MNTVGILIYDNKSLSSFRKYQYIYGNKLFVSPYPNRRYL